MAGLFITFEGTEGAGKSTLIQSLAAELKFLGFEVCKTREPGGSALAEKVRALIIHEEMDAWTELMLYEASRAEHLARTVRPALENDATVLCDRYSDSSLAYQGEARGLPWKKVLQANALATQGLTPDLTVFLDIDPEFALKRASDPNRFEREGVEFQKRVRKGFLRAMKEKPRRWFRLRVKEQTPAELTTAVLREMQRRFPAAFRRASKREESLGV